MSNVLTTQQKALKLNLDETIYGTFAEIGAGQEVAANFFKAGAASGTIAKSISAYDMTFSDSIYGKEESGRYVCQSRVEKMIDYEFNLLLERLTSKFPSRHFFAFANTVVARNYQGTNHPHGWLGIRFQTDCSKSYNDLIIHIRMHDNTNALQQKALGILGVNMIHAIYNSTDSVEGFLKDIMSNLSAKSIEVDMLEVRGEAFKNIDNRLLNLQLLIDGITDAVMFDETGDIKLAQDELYKKNIMLVRGSYRPPTKVNVDILNISSENFKADIKSDDVTSLAEMTLNHLKEDGEITSNDFLARVDLLASIGQKVLITNMPQYHKLTTYISTFKPANLGVVLGVYNFMQIFKKDYKHLDGGVLASLGSFFQPYVKVYLYPYREENKEDVLVNSMNVEVAPEHEELYKYIRSGGQIKDIVGYNDSLLHIYSRKVLRMIRNNEKGWEKLVPKEISDTINEKCLFGHPCVKE